MSFPILLFTQDAATAAAALRAGAGGVVVDWEWRDKESRQRGAGTEINRGTAECLRAVRSSSAGHVICRINNLPQQRVEEVRLAQSLGANEIWLPMVRSIGEVEDCLRVLAPGMKLGILAETRAALALARGLSALPLSRVYFGLNDFRIDSGSADLFAPLRDGTVEGFREAWGGAFGVAGVTRPDAGHPLPQWLLLAEMARLSCDFGVARRSFRADVAESQFAAAFAAIESRHAALRRRTPTQIEADRSALLRLLADPADSAVAAVAG